MHAIATRLVVMLVTTVFFIPGFSQGRKNPGIFFKNIVETGEDDFGTIIGEDQKNNYFICVRNAGDGISDDTLYNIRFYRSSYVRVATRVKDFFFDSYRVVLYQCEKDPSNKWQKEYYGSATSNMGAASTFLYTGSEDSLWSVSTQKISVHEILKVGQLMIHVAKNSAIKRGMPFVSDLGFIGGIFAEQGNGRTLVPAINITDIEELIYIYSDCRYFNMIEFRRRANRCIVERAEILVNQNQRQPEQAKKNHFIDYGLYGSIAGESGPLNVSINTAPDNFPFNYGASFYLNIDTAHHQRVTVKAGEGKYDESGSITDGIWSSPDGKLKMTSSAYQVLNISFAYEKQFYRSRNFSGSLGLGYNFGITGNQSFVIRNNGSTDQYSRYHITKTALRNRLIGEVHFLEWKVLRLGFIFGRDIGKFPNQRYSFSQSGVSYMPFDNKRKRGFIGLEGSIRGRGDWKHK